MLPLSLLKTAQAHPVLVELKNGETYNGHMVNCDSWMNVHLREVICTSKDGDRFFRMPEIYIRGNTIKYIRVPDEVIDKVKEEIVRRQDRPAGGRGRGRGRGGWGGDEGGGRGGRGEAGGRGEGGGRGGRGGPSTRGTLSAFTHHFILVRVEPEIFRFNGVYRLIYYYCGCSSDYGGVVATEVS
eukprot:jgi/Chrzof1/10439/UNPLg00366.t1